MTFTLTLLLCLGLTLGLWIPGLTRTLPKPILRVQPDSVVSNHTNVTLLCEGARGSKQYHLYKLRSPDSWPIKILLEPGNKVEFSISKVEPHHAGVYCCYYYIQDGWSEGSETQELVVAGTLQKPTIKSESGSIIASGSPNTIWCQGTLDVELYVLHKEGNQKPWNMKTPEESSNEAKFSIPSVTQQHGGQYRCYCYSSAGWLERSDSLELVVTGIHYYKPSLSVLPSPVVTSGRNMTLQCVSWVRYEKFILTKENEKFTSSLNAQYIYPTRNYQVLFSMENMTPDHAGTFRCYGYYKNTPYLWSVPSEPLEIHILGPIGTPSKPPLRPMSTAILEMYLKILTGVSLVYLLFLFILIFILLLRNHQDKFKMYAPKETELQLIAPTAELVTRDRGPQKRKSMIGDLDFHLLDTYPCQLTSRCLSRANPASATHEERFYASMEDKQSEDDVELDSWRPAEEQPHGVIYAQVKPSRLRRAGAVLPSVMSKESLETKVGQVEEGREMDSQAAKNEGPQDVTYVQMCRRTLKLGKASSHHFQAGENPKESGVYATLAGTGPSPVFKNKE